MHNSVCSKGQWTIDSTLLVTALLDIVELLLVCSTAHSSFVTTRLFCIMDPLCKSCRADRLAWQAFQRDAKRQGVDLSQAGQHGCAEGKSVDKKKHEEAVLAYYEEYKKYKKAQADKKKKAKNDKTTNQHTA